MLLQSRPSQFFDFTGKRTLPQRMIQWWSEINDKTTTISIDVGHSVPAVFNFRKCVLRCAEHFNHAGRPKLVRLDIVILWCVFDYYLLFNRRFGARRQLWRVRVVVRDWDNSASDIPHPCLVI